MALNAEQLKFCRELKLSPHFTLLELINSTSHFGLVDFPNKDIIAKLEWHAKDILEPLREKFGRIRVNSGYRNPFLNNAVGGVENSIHQIYHKGKYLGTATDIFPIEEPDFVKVMAYISKKIPAVKRVILYRDPSLGLSRPFLHLDRDARVPKDKTVFMEKISKTKYINFDTTQFDQYEF